MPLPLDSLTISQQVIRRPDEIARMVKHVREGKGWHECDQPIWITRFEDGMLLLHNGHHRAVSTHLGGRFELLAGEYEFHDYKYIDYTSLVPENGYFTPFDPRTEVRLGDFKPFKDMAVRLYIEQPEALAAYVRDNKHLYAEPRRIWRVSELAETVWEPA
jgi:hypothetical protein